MKKIKFKKELTFTELLLLLPDYQLAGNSKALSDCLRVKCLVRVKIKKHKAKEFFWDLTKLTIVEQNKSCIETIKEILEALENKEKNDR
jgi:predicted DNA-binding ribbon-helix-helix protein